MTRLVALIPDAATSGREQFGKWVDAQLVEHLIDGLRKAGLDVSDARGPR